MRPSHTPADLAAAIRWLSPTGETVAAAIEAQGLSPADCTGIVLAGPLAPRVTFMMPDGRRVIVDRETARGGC